MTQFQSSTDSNEPSSDSILTSIAKRIPGTLFRRNSKGNHEIIWSTEPINQLTGYSVDQMFRQRQITFSELIHPLDKMIVVKTIAAALADSGSYDVEYRLIDREQSIKWVLEQGNCGCDKNGEPCLDGIIVEIDERKSAQSELVSKGLLIEGSLNEIFIFSAETLQFTYVNQAGRDNLGYCMNELEQMTPLDIKPRFTKQSFEQMVLPLTDDSQQVVIETKHRRKDGTLYDAEIRLHRSRFRDQDVFLAMIHDVTDRVQAESKNSKLQKELIDASRKAGMTEVATGVLHNVGNILNSVNVSASMIRQIMEASALTNFTRVTDLLMEHQDDFENFIQHDDRGKKLPGFLHMIAMALARERGQVTDEFLDLAKNIEHIKEIIAVQQSMAKSSGLIQELSPAELVNDVMTATKGSLTNHEIDVVLEITPLDSLLYSDKHKVLQILINLIENAKDAIKEQKSESPKIEILTFQRNDEVVFQIIDNGIGIPAERINQIFQHGFTTKDSGHGFGLHSSAIAARELDGRLMVSSPGPGLGAKFELSIPLSDSSEPPSTVANPPGALPQLSTDFIPQTSTQMI